MNNRSHFCLRYAIIITSLGVWMVHYCQAAHTAQLTKYLILDSRNIESIEGARLELGAVEKDSHNPLFGADRAWEVRLDNFYPNVIHDESTGLFRCWYSPFIIDPATSDTVSEDRHKERYLTVLNRIGSGKREMGLCYATSEDGIHWEKPDLELYDFDGSKQNNLVLRIQPRGPHGAGVLLDDHASDPAHAFKLFFALETVGLRLSTSADGLHWDTPTDCSGVKVAGDTHNCLLWIPSEQKYVGFTRTWQKVRQVARTESTDLKTWTSAEVVLQGDDPRYQTYDMQVFEYSGIYLGLLMVMDTQTDTVHCELAWSPDTQEWHRVCPGKMLVSNGRDHSYDCGCVYAAAPIVIGDRMLLYYGGSNGLHGNWRDSFLCRAELKLDHWAGYRPNEATKPGRIVTRPMMLTGNTMQLTADTKGGSIFVSILGDQGEILAKSNALSVDVIDGEVSWNKPGALAHLVGRKVRIGFDVDKATLYSFRISGERLQE